MCNKRLLTYLLTYYWSLIFIHISIYTVFRGY